MGLCRKETNEVAQAAIEDALRKYEMQTTLIGFFERGVSAWIVALLVYGLNYHAPGFV